MVWLEKLHLESFRDTKALNTANLMQWWKFYIPHHFKMF